MTWLQLDVVVGRERVEAAGACLEAHGAVAVTMRNAGENVLLEPAPGAQPLWDQVCLRALFDLSVDLAAVRVGLAGLDGRVQDVAFLGDADWLSSWRAHAVRACFAGRLWLLPRDEPVPADGPEGAVVLRLEPGLAFGSGSHPTTRLCLSALAGLPLDGLRVLDFGCGSGVLGLAACLLGAASVVAVDHDPQALVATQDNATYNHLAADRLRVMTPEALPDQPPFDVVVANILAGPLVALAPRLTRLTAPEGWVLLSGLLDDQAGEVRAAYPQVAFSPPSREAEWICLAGQRQPPTDGH